MKKYSYLIFLLFVGALVGCANNEAATLDFDSYEQFTAQAEAIFEHLEELYPDSKVSETVVTSNPSREEWIEGDTDVIENNSSIPRKLEMYIMNDPLYSITKVTLVYRENLEDREFLSVNRIDSFSEQFLNSGNKEYDLPQIYAGSFADNHLYINLVTFTTEPYTGSDEKEYERLLVAFNHKIINDIQDKLIEMDE